MTLAVSQETYSNTTSEDGGDYRIAQIQAAFPELSDFRKCADGSYGSVYIARHTLLEREQAVKIVDCPPGSDREREWHGLLNFCRRIHSHPNLITIYDTRRPYGASYFCYTMELADNISAVEGKYEAATLDARLESQACLPSGEIIDITLGILDGLSVLHNAGMIHRDIKPHNIMIVNGVPKLGDIGLVTNASSESSIVGTPQYLPAEFKGHEGSGSHLTQATDLYALAITMYRMMTGLGASNFPVIPEDLMEQSPEIQELNAFIMRAADANPARRYNTVAEFRRALVRARERGRNARRRLWNYLFTVLMIVAGIAIGGIVFRNRHHAPQPDVPDVQTVNPLTLPWDTDIHPANPALAKQDRMGLQAPEYCYSPWKLRINGESAIEAVLPAGKRRTLLLEAPQRHLTAPFELYFEVKAEIALCRMELLWLDADGAIISQVPVLLTPPGVFPASLEEKLAEAGIEAAPFTWGIRAACERGTICITANGNNFGGNLITLPQNVVPASFRIRLNADGDGDVRMQNLVLFFNR